MKTNLHILASSLALIGGIVSLVYHLGAMTPVVPPVINTLLEGESEIDRKAPFKAKPRVDDLEAPFEERYHFLDFHQAAEKHGLYTMGFFLWMSAMMLWLIRFGFQARLRFNKVMFLVSGFLCLYGIKHLYQGVAGAIMAFDTMGISGGSDPARLSLAIGESTTATMIGWIFVIVAAVCLIASPLVAIKALIIETESSKKSKVFASIGLGFCLIGLVFIVLNYFAAEAIGGLTSDHDPSDIAVTISHFLMSYAMVVLAGFFLMVFFTIAFLVRKKGIEAV